MELSDMIIVILLISCISMWYLVSTQKEDCVPQKVIVKEYIFKPELDLQFDQANFPSKLYDNVFTKPNVYQGGYNMDQGRNIITTKNDKVTQIKSL